MSAVIKVGAETYTLSDDDGTAIAVAVRSWHHPSVSVESIIDVTTEESGVVGIVLPAIVSIRMDSAQPAPPDQGQAQ